MSVASVRVNALWTLAGNTGYMACQWLILALLARHFHVEAVGRYALSLAFTAPIFLLCALQLRSLQATDTKAEFTFAQYAFVRCLSLIAAVAAVACASAFSGWERQMGVIILAVTTVKCTESLSDICHGALHRVGNMRRIAISLIMRGIASTGSFAAVAFATNSLTLSILTMALAQSLMVIFVDVPAARAVGAGVQNGQPSGPFALRPTVSAIVRLAAPLGVIAALLSVSANLPRYFLQAYRGEAEVGVFAAVAYVTVAGNIVVSAVVQSAAPRFARLWHDNAVHELRSMIYRLTFAVCALGFVACLLGIAFGRDLLRLAYGPIYAKGSYTLSVLLAASAFQFGGTVLGMALTAVRSLKVQLPVHVASVALTTALCFGFIPIWGSAGAAYAIVAVAASMMLVYLFLVESRLRTPHHTI